MIALSTTCMAEVIGDDLHSIIETARNEGVITNDFPVPYANTPSFVGSHINGYDSMLKSILSYLSEKNEDSSQVGETGKVNIILGFETYTGNFDELKRILSMMDVDYTILGDHSGNLDSPADGKYHLYYGGLN